MPPCPCFSLHDNNTITTMAEQTCPKALQVGDPCWKGITGTRRRSRTFHGDKVCLSFGWHTLSGCKTEGLLRLLSWLVLRLLRLWGFQGVAWSGSHTLSLSRLSSSSTASGSVLSSSGAASSSATDSASLCTTKQSGQGLDKVSVQFVVILHYLRLWAFFINSRLCATLQPSNGC